MKKIKVIMIGPALDMKGGIASVSKTLIESNDTDQFDVRYISSYVDGNKINKLAAAFIGIIKMLILCIMTNIKIVHIHSASRGSFRRKFFYYLLAKIFNKKVIYHIHGGEFMLYYNEVNALEKKIITLLLTNVDKVIALSKKWKDDLQSISPEASIEIIHNPVKVSMFNRGYEKEKSINILFMGKLGENKGVYDLLHVIPNIIKKHENVYFYLYGDGEIERVKEIVNSNSLEKKVFVPGWVNTEQKIEYLNKGSIYILPSYNEGLPISILEAMASSLPIIATNVGGIPEIVEDNKNGYLISPGDINRLEESLLKLIESKELRQEFGNCGLKKSKKYFDVNIIAQKINHIYDLILK